MKLPYLLVKPLAWAGTSWLNQNDYFRERLALIEGETIALKVKGCSKPLVFAVAQDRLKGPLCSGEQVSVTVSASPKVLWDILRGQVDPDAAFFQRQIEVQGHLAVALVLKNAFDDLVH